MGTNKGDTEPPSDEVIWQRFQEPNLEAERFVQTLAFVGNVVMPKLAGIPRYADLTPRDVLRWFGNAAVESAEAPTRLVVHGATRQFVLRADSGTAFVFGAASDESGDDTAAVAQCTAAASTTPPSFHTYEKVRIVDQAGAAASVIRVGDSVLLEVLDQGLESARLFGTGPIATISIVTPAS